MTKDRLTRITIDDAQCGGRPCIRGMRIRVTDILELLSAGATLKKFCGELQTLCNSANSPAKRTKLVRLRPLLECNSATGFGRLRGFYPLPQLDLPEPSFNDIHAA
jgi:Protein of unknown function (DUF433)